MSTFEVSVPLLRNAAGNTGVIGQAITSHPVHRMTVGDLGHAGVSAALVAFQQAWAAELALRGNAADGAGRLLQGAAADTEHADMLLASAASGVVAV